MVWDGGINVFKGGESEGFVWEENSVSIVKRMRLSSKWVRRFWEGGMVGILEGRRECGFR